MQVANLAQSAGVRVETPIQPIAALGKIGGHFFDDLVFREHQTPFQFPPVTEGIDLVFVGLFDFQDFVLLCLVRRYKVVVQVRRFQFERLVQVRLKKVVVDPRLVRDRVEGQVDVITRFRATQTAV